MTGERWRQIKQILEALEDCPLDTRESILDASCGSDTELRREVESLLSCEERAEALDRSADRNTLPHPVAKGPERIGPYRIERLLGTGGMGSVFLAVRDDDQYSKRVAIKLIQWAGNQETAGRFRTERQVLANLDHPNIARLLDGGSLPDGQPYLVMDYIDGHPIDVYVRERALTTDAIVRLFLDVCSAVQYAHQNLIIHRDIKAGNILVGSDGKPHLLDFGIAKLLNPSGPEMDRTQPWQRVLTPASASPEQAAGGAITTASDVYSLGVLLYGLLTGVPFYREARQFAEDPGRAIREYEPPAASEVPGLAAQVRRSLAGDLDNVLRKATSKDPEKRYPTVEEFAADLRRYLEGHPVTARPASVIYRLAKFTKRNRLAVSAALLLFVAVFAGTVGTAWYAWRARLAEAHAEQRFEALHRLTNTMLFEVDDALINLQGATAARAAIVNRTLGYLDQMASDSTNNPAVLKDLASAYFRIGRIQGAEDTAHLGGPGSLQASRKSLQKALEIQKRLVAAERGNRNLQADLIDTEAQIGGTWRYEGDLERALEVDRDLVSRTKAMAAQSPTHDQTYVDSQYRLSGILTGMGDTFTSLGELPRAFECLREGLAVRNALLAEHPGDKRAQRVVGIAHNYLCRTYEAATEWNKAADEARLALSNWEPLAAADPHNVEIHGMVADASQHLCGDLTHMGKFGEALQDCRKSLDLYQAAANGDPNNVQAEEDLATALSAMSEVAEHLGKPPEAIRWESKARALYAVIEKNDPDSFEAATDDAASLLHLGSLEGKSGSQAAARRYVAQARDMLLRQMKQSPKNREVADLYRRAVSALEARR